MNQKKLRHLSPDSITDGKGTKPGYSAADGQAGNYEASRRWGDEQAVMAHSRIHGR